MKIAKVIAVIFSVILLSCDRNHGVFGDAQYNYVNGSSHDISIEIYITTNPSSQSGILQFEKKISIKKGDTVSFDHYIDNPHFFLFNVDKINFTPADSAVLKFDEKKQLSHCTSNPDTLSYERNIFFSGYITLNGNSSPYYYYITDEDYDLAIPY